MRVPPGLAVAAVLSALALGAFAHAEQLGAQGEAQVQECRAADPRIDLCTLQSLDEDLAAARARYLGLALGLLALLCGGVTAALGWRGPSA